MAKDRNNHIGGLYAATPTPAPVRPDGIESPMTPAACTLRDWTALVERVGAPRRSPMPSGIFIGPPGISDNPDLELIDWSSSSIPRRPAPARRRMGAVVAAGRVVAGGDPPLGASDSVDACGTVRGGGHLLGSRGCGVVPPGWCGGRMDARGPFRSSGAPIRWCDPRARPASSDRRGAGRARRGVVVSVELPRGHVPVRSRDPDWEVFAPVDARPVPAAEPD